MIFFSLAVTSLNVLLHFAIELKFQGQELAPFERELANLRKEINIAEQGKRDLEQEYLRHQHELFSLNRQSSVRSEENDMYKKRLAIMEGKKFQLEGNKMNSNLLF